MKRERVGTSSDAADSDLAEPQTGATPRTGIGTGVALTAAAWLACRTVVGCGWATVRDPFRFNPNFWGKWDTSTYLSIATRGRTFVKCPSTYLLSKLAGQRKCGSAGWLPGYPWLIRAVQVTGIGRSDAALLIPWVAMGVALFVIWFGWCRDLHPSKALLVLVAFGVFPGAVYNYAMFPTAVALAALVGALLAITRERFLVGAALLTVAGLTYPSAWFAAGGLSIAMVLVVRSHGSDAVVRRALWGATGLASLLILGAHDQLVFGHANAYMLIVTQGGLDSHHFPGSQFVQTLVHRNTVEQVLIGSTAANALAIQALLAVVTVGLATAYAARTWIRKRIVDDVYPAAAGLGVAIGVLVLQATGGAWNRSIVLAAPCVICLRRIPARWLILLVIATGLATVFVSRSYFAGKLV